jgi:hypothetical protein
MGPGEADGVWESAYAANREQSRVAKNGEYFILSILGKMRRPRLGCRLILKRETPPIASLD